MFLRWFHKERLNVFRFPMQLSDYMVPKAWRDALHHAVKDLGWDMTKLGLHAEKQVKIMWSLLYENDKVSLESLCFAACPAWKRDLSDMWEGETGEWFAELKAWATVE